nr:MAG: hypothetical protein [uncultured archaeon]
MGKIETDTVFDLTTESKKLLLEYLKECVTKPQFRILPIEQIYLIKLIRNDLEDKSSITEGELSEDEELCPNPDIDCDLCPRGESLACPLEKEGEL